MAELLEQMQRNGDLVFDHGKTRKKFKVSRPAFKARPATPAATQGDSDETSDLSQSSLDAKIFSDIVSKLRDSPPPSSAAATRPEGRKKWVSSTVPLRKRRRQLRAISFSL